MDRMEKKKRRKPEIGTYDVVKVIPMEPVMHMIKAVPLSTIVSKVEPQVEPKVEPKEQPKEQQTEEAKEEAKEEQKVEPKAKLEIVDDVKKKRNSCFLC